MSKLPLALRPGQYVLVAIRQRMHSPPPHRHLTRRHLDSTAPGAASPAPVQLLTPATASVSQAAPVAPDAASPSAARTGSTALVSRSAPGSSSSSARR